MTTIPTAHSEMFAVMCVGKTGGTSLSNALHEAFRADRCLRELQHLGFSVLGHIHRDELELYLRRMPDSKFNKLRMIVGHIPIGLGGTFKRAEFHYITMLREPVARLVSTFFYLNQNHPRTDIDYLNAALHRAISKGNDVIYSNPMTRVFTGSEALVPRVANRGLQPPAEVTNYDFDLAIENLRKFKFVGLTERFRDSIRLIFGLLGQDFHKTVPKDNETKITLRPEQVHPDTLAVLKRLTRFDQKLYAEAAQIFSRHAAQANLPTFAYQESVDLDIAPISSGDLCQYTSAAAAISDRPDGVWVASGTPKDCTWLGIEFNHSTVCESVSIQLPKCHASGKSVFQLEASDDAFQNHILSLNHLEIPYDGNVHRFEIAPPHSFRYWRIRRKQLDHADSTQIVYFGLNRQKNENRRDMNAVKERIALANKIAGE